MQTLRIFIVLLFLNTVSCLSASIANNYKISNYSASDYSATLQNWDICLDKNGLVLVANNGGMLLYNGSNWKFLELQNKESIRAIKKIGDKIYTSGDKNIGYWQRDNTGNYRYTDLIESLPNPESKDDNYWSIATDGKSIYFQSFSRILQLQDKKFTQISVDCHMLLQQVGNEIYTQRLGVGIFQLKNGTFYKLIDNSAIQGEEIKFAARLSDKSLLFGMHTGNFYRLDTNKQLHKDEKFARQLDKNVVDCVIIYKNKYLLVGTLSNGIYIFTLDGKLENIITYKNGLQGNSVHRMQSFANQIWVSLDNGLSQIILDPSIRVWKKHNEIGRFYQTAMLGNSMYIATNHALYKYNTDDPSEELHPVIKEATQSLDIIKGHLLVSSIDGFHEILPNGGIGNISYLKGINAPYYIAENGEEYIVAPSYTYISYYKYVNNSWKLVSEVTNLMNSFEVLVPETPQLLWAVHPQKGIYMIRVNNDLNQATSVTQYAKEEGLEQYKYINIHKIDGEVYFFSPEGVFQHNKETHKFIKNQTLTNDMKESAGAYCVCHPSPKELWAFCDSEIHIYNINEQRAQLTNKISFLDNEISPLKERIKVSRIGFNRYMIPTEEGATFIDLNKLSDQLISYGPLHIESVVYYIDGKEHRLELNDKNTFDIPNKASNITLSVAKSPFSSSSLVRYKLKTDNNPTWSKWSKNGIFKFDKLPAGNYELLVEDYKGGKINIMLNIYTPFYASTSAIFSYILILMVIIFLFIRRRYRIKREKLIQHYKIEQQLKDEEIIRLTNEQMKQTINQQKNEINDKLRAISQKQEILISLEKEIDFQKKELGDRYPKKMYEKLKSIISGGMSTENDFLLFQNYYQEINHEFLLRLKEKHPDLSSLDLKFCCLLRSNLSTKDIASILNITTKSVDLKRYRLKKKLNLEGSLTDYILSI